MKNSIVFASIAQLALATFLVATNAAPLAVLVVALFIALVVAALEGEKECW